MLNLAVTGTEGMLTPRSSVGMQEVITQEDELESVREGPSTPSTPAQDLLAGFATRKPVKDNNTGNESLRLAARVVGCFCMIIYLVSSCHKQLTENYNNLSFKIFVSAVRNIEIFTAVPQILMTFQ